MAFYSEAEVWQEIYTNQAKYWEKAVKWAVDEFIFQLSFEEYVHFEPWCFKKLR